VIFRQLIDADTKTQTYLIGDPWSREAVIIDAVRENVERDLAFIDELGLKLVYALETHVHADHITGAGLLRHRTGCAVIVSRAGEVSGVDIEVTDGDAIRFGLQAIEVRATPGHTAGCVTYVSANRPMAFTGDALFIRGCGRTDFQGGSARTLFRSVRDKLFSLPDETLIYPGHDYRGRTVSTVREEKLYNPRLGGGKTEDQFVEIMAGLNLAYPRKIDVAVPANRSCGVLPDDVAPDSEPAAPWPARRTPTGAPNLPAIWVAENRDGLRLIDVREPEEQAGPDGRLDGAEPVRMCRVVEEAARWDRGDRLVLYCRSGGRSDRAAVDLERLGFKSAASMTGGS